MHSALEAEKMNRIRIGVVYCRIRLRKKRVRYFRCLGQDHEARNCNGSDRKGGCNKCGKVGHIARKCETGKEEVDQVNLELAD